MPAGRHRKESIMESWKYKKKPYHHKYTKKEKEHLWKEHHLQPCLYCGILTPMCRPMCSCDKCGYAEDVALGKRDMMSKHTKGPETAQQRDDLLAMCIEFREFLGQSSKYDSDNEITPRLEALIDKVQKSKK